MKGFRKTSVLSGLQEMRDTVILKTLPYGMWKTERGIDILFNRDYEPTRAWDSVNNVQVPAYITMWVEDIIPEETIMYYQGVPYPTKSKDTMRKCIDILAEWDARVNAIVSEEGIA